jgi:hypothetical protein
MTAQKILPFAGTDEELEKYLLEFARLVSGWTARTPGRDGWILSAGARLSTNPNTLPWRIRVSRQSDGVVLENQTRALPWMRAKAARIGSYREGQLGDYLTARVRGSGPEKFDALRLRAPFTPFGEGVAALTASFAWAVLTGLAAFAFALVSAVLASLPLMSLSIREIAAHAAALQQAGALPLPTPAEAAATGALGTAVIFAFPIAFFAGLVHAAAVTASDLGFRAARVPQSSFLFLAILIGFAFFPFLPVLALPLSLLIPAGAHLGASLVSARRRERVREGGPPRKMVLLIGVILAASLAGAVVPRGGEWKESLVRIALFRDAWLLGNPLGKKIASTYYRYTLYTAEPLKELYSTDEKRAVRQQPLASCSDPAVAIRLRALHFVVTPDRAGSDVVVGPGGVAPSLDLAELKTALDEYSRKTFRGGHLRNLCSVAWQALYFAGPLAVLIVFMGIFAPFVSLLFRRLRPKTAIFALSACAMVTSLSLVLLSGDDRRTYAPADLAEALTDPRPGIRHEAAFRAFQLDSSAPLAEALLKAADDGDLRVRLWACAALGKSAEPRALAKLVERLDDPEIFVRYRAAEGLELLRDPKAVEPLLKMIHERSWYEGSYALDALRRIRPERF